MGTFLSLDKILFLPQEVISAKDWLPYEPIFDLDVTFAPNRTQWYNSDVFDAQPYQSFGIKTDSTFRCTREGKIFENLYAAGAILEGFNPLKEGCGAGVSILSAMYIAEQILSK